MALRGGHFRVNWKLGLFTLLLFPVLMGLGFWQLAREQEKLALQEIYRERADAPPRLLDELDRDASLQYRRVRVTGRYDNDRSFLLDNRIHQGRPGFEVITPFLTAGGLTVLVNRGWMPLGPSRQDLPEVPPVTGEVTVTGTVYVPPGDPLVLGADAPFDGWPHLIQALDPAEMFRTLGQALSARAAFPYSVRLAENQAGVLVRNWEVVSVTPARHRGYAIQWFAMAAVLLGLFVYSGFRESGRGRDEE